MSEPKVLVLIPVGGTCPWRRASLGYQLSRIRESLGWPVITCTDTDPAFNRGRALNEGLFSRKQLFPFKPDVVVFLDGDLLIDPLILREQARLLMEDPSIGYVVPFLGVNYLTPNYTRKVISHNMPLDALVGNLRKTDIAVTFNGKSDGGANLVRFDNMIYFDPRFKGWGYEDAAWAAAMQTLVGPCRWVESPAHHLWHPPADKMTQNQKVSESLCARYSGAFADKEAMKALIDEYRGFYEG